MAVLYLRGCCTHRETLELSETDTLRDQLRQVEGTVLLHLTFAMRQQQELGRDFIKLLKVDHIYYTL